MVHARCPKQLALDSGAAELVCLMAFLQLWSSSLLEGMETRSLRWLSWHLLHKIRVLANEAADFKT